MLTVKYECQEQSQIQAETCMQTRADTADTVTVTCTGTGSMTGTRTRVRSVTGIGMPAPRRLYLVLTARRIYLILTGLNFIDK